MLSLRELSRAWGLSASSEHPNADTRLKLAEWVAECIQKTGLLVLADPEQSLQTAVEVVLLQLDDKPDTQDKSVIVVAH